MRALAVLAVAVLVALVLLRVFRDRVVPRFIFFPEPLRPLESDPARWGWPEAEEMSLVTEDGVRLHAWWFPAAGEGPARGAAVFFHGNAGHVGYRGEVGARLSRLGLDVLLPDYRGYGLSEGSPSESGLRRDAEAAYRRVLERSGQPPERLLVVGNSLGSAVAAWLAGRRPVGAVALVGPFTEAASVGRRAYPFLPGWVFEWEGNRFETAAPLAELEAPLLVVAGTRDRVVAPEESRAVYEAAAGPKRWLLLEGADHADALGHPLLWRELATFTERHLGGGAPASGAVGSGPG